MTYNVEEASSTGMEGGEQIAPWSARRAGAAALIREARPDVIAVEEAAAWVGPIQGHGGVRQIDDLRRLLPGYALATTETPPSEPGYFRTGVYILYRSAYLHPVGTGGHWNVGYTRWAAYQQFQTSTGTQFLFTAAHLLVGSGRANDDRRATETANLIALSTRRAGGLPVVYGGDWNSDTARSHAYDAPSVVMHAHHNVNTRYAARRTYNERYDSANQNMRRPIAAGQSIDGIYTSPGSVVTSWSVVLHLRNGAFVGTIPSDHNPVLAAITIAS